MKVKLKKIKGDNRMDNLTTKWAYEMQEAYTKTITQGEAVKKVRDKNPLAGLNILWAMWAAIDAYVDSAG